MPEPHGPEARSGFARGDGLLPWSAWPVLTGIPETSKACRWSTDGPWPRNASELVHGVDVAVTTDAVACLRTAVKHAGRLSFVSSISIQDASDPQASLRARLEDLVAAFGDVRVDVPGLVGLRDAADAVLALSADVSGPLADMWAYVAATAAHVASHELALREVDEDVTTLRL